MVALGLFIGQSALNAAWTFAFFDDQEISFVDHTTGVPAPMRDVEHVFAFDGGFRTLGFSIVPDNADVGGVTDRR